MLVKPKLNEVVVERDTKKALLLKNKYGQLGYLEKRWAKQIIKLDGKLYIKQRTFTKSMPQAEYFIANERYQDEISDFKANYHDLSSIIIDENDKEYKIAFTSYNSDTLKVLQHFAYLPKSEMNGTEATGLVIRKHALRLALALRKQIKWSDSLELAFGEVVFGKFDYGYNAPFRFSVAKFDKWSADQLKLTRVKV